MDAALEALLVYHEQRVCKEVSAALVAERTQLKREVASLFEQGGAAVLFEQGGVFEPGPTAVDQGPAQITGKRQILINAAKRCQTRQLSMGPRESTSDDDEDKECPNARMSANLHDDQNERALTWDIREPVAQNVSTMRAKAVDSLSDASSAETEVTNHATNRATFGNFNVHAMSSHDSVMATTGAVASEDEFSTRYEFIMAAFIVANAAFLGVQVDQAAGNGGNDSIPIRVISASFALLFIFDLVIRVYKLGVTRFICGRRRHLNLLDAVVVFFMVLELAVAPPWSDQQVGALRSVSVLRICRLARLTRLVRFVRVANAFSELHALMYALHKSWRILAWVLMMIGATLYITALSLTTAAPEGCGESIDGEAFCEHFGDLRRSLRSCFLTMYGGIDWGTLLDALAEVSAVYSVFFVLFLTFAFTILANLVTGLFLQLMRETTHDEKQLLVNNEMRRIMKQIHHLEGAFIEIDVNQSGTISKDELEMAVRDPRMASLLSALNLELSDTSTLFALLDRHRVGAVNINEFVEGCMRLTGDARAVHFQAVRLDLKTLERKFRRLDEKLFGRKRRRAVISPQERCLTPDCRPRLPSTGQTTTLNSRMSRRVSNLFTRTQVPATIATLMKPQMSDVWGTPVAAKDRQPIQLAEHRAMSLFELRSVWRLVKALCVHEEWRDPESGKMLLPDDVNLYTLSYNHICPQGVVGGVTLVGLTNVDAELMPFGLQVEQRDTKWALPMASGVVDHFDEDGAPVIVVTRGRFECTTSTSCHVFLGDIDCGVPTDVRPELALSYKELISTVPLKPQWFCSHWWGMSIIDFVMNCVQHHEYRQCECPSYWVCGYANRQYELGSDLNVDPQSSSFNRAMALAKGMLLHLDHDATPLSRIWCDFEIYRTLKTDKMLDIATAVRTSHKSAASKRVTRLLTDGHKDSETTFAKMQRESSFPVRIFIKGMTTCLEDGQSTVESDKARIMRTILRMAGEDYDDNQISQSPSSRLIRFKMALSGRSGSATPGSALVTKISKGDSWMGSTDSSEKSASVRDSSGGQGGDQAEDQLILERELLQINSALHGYFARAAWPQAVRLKTLDDFDAENPRSLKLSDIVGRDESLKTLTLTLAHVPNVNDSTLQAIGRALPAQLRVLQLSFEGCGQVEDNGVAHLTGRLPGTLRTLALDFLGCRKLTDRSVKVIARNLPEGLVDLRLDFANCPLLTRVGVEALCSSAPQGLRTCLVTLKGTEINRNFRSLNELRTVSKGASSDNSLKNTLQVKGINSGEFS